MARKRQRAKDRKQKLHRENIPGSLDHASGEVEEVEAAIVAGADGKPVEPAPEGVADEPVDAVEPDAVDAVEPDAVEAEPDAFEPEPEPEPEVEVDEVVGPEPDGLEPDPDPDDVEPEPVAAAVTPAPKRRRNRRKRGAAAEPVEPLEPVEPETVDDYAAGDDDDDDDEDEGVYGEGVDADAAEVEHDRLGKGAGDLAVTPDAHKPAGFRVTNFIRACWAELQRVDWPDRRQVGQATAVVLGFVVVAGAFLGLADVVAQRIVDFIL